MNRLVYRPEAAADVRAAFEWYERQREGLGGEFLAELARVERTVQRSPLAFRVVRRDARRIMLRTAALLLLDRPTLQSAALLVVLVWASARFYYFLFYVLEKYVDPSLRYSGLIALLTALARRRRDQK